MKSTLLAGCAGLCLALSMSLSAQAAVVVEAFTAEVAGYSTIEWAPVGSTFTGQFSYDPDAPIALGPVPFPDGPVVTAYDALSMTLDFGAGHTLVAGGVRLLVMDNTLDPPGQGLALNAGLFRMGDVAYASSEFSMLLIAPQDTALQTALPGSLRLSDYPVAAYGGLTLDVTDFDNPAGLSYQLTSLSPVPEASAVWLALAGLGVAALAAGGRRRSGVPH